MVGEPEDEVEAITDAERREKKENQIRRHQKTISIYYKGGEDGRHKVVVEIDLSALKSEFDRIVDLTKELAHLREKETDRFHSIEVKRV